MGDIQFNSGYLSSGRGIQKIVQIILAIVVCAVLCANWYGGTSCFREGRLGFVSSVNFVVLIINVIVLILNLMNVDVIKFERFYALLAVIFFFIAIALMLWFLIGTGQWIFWNIAVFVCIIVILFTFMSDYRLLTGARSDHLPI